MNLPDKILAVPVGKMEQFLTPCILRLLRECATSNGYDSLEAAVLDLREDPEMEQIVGGLLDLIYEPDDGEDGGEFVPVVVGAPVSPETGSVAEEAAQVITGEINNGNVK